MAASFETGLRDPFAPVTTIFSDANSPLLVAFGGINGGLGVPPLEFFNLTRAFPANKIFVRDFEQAWYQHGVGNLARDVDETASYLQKEFARLQPSRIALVGNSMGGYAALLFGVLLGANVVHAFSPQTFIDRRHRIWYRDTRWSSQVAHAQRAGSKYLDLKKVLSARSARGNLHIHYSRADRWDRIHAERLHAIPSITLHAYETGGHELVKQLRASGALYEILAPLLAG